MRVAGAMWTRRNKRTVLAVLLMLTCSWISVNVYRYSVVPADPLDPKHKKSHVSPIPTLLQSAGTTTPYHVITSAKIAPRNPGPHTTILLWTSFFKNPKWGLPELGRTPFLTKKCAYNNCVLQTSKDTYMESADMLLFSCVDDVSVPAVRHPRQIYAAYCWEPPCYVTMDKFKKLSANMTVTYRQDSDLVDWAKKIKVKDTPSPGPYVPKIPFKLKTKTLVWAVSNCNPPSKRQLYAEELSKYVDLDIYGECGKFKCPRMAAECYQKFEQQYKFYLAFENSICKGYVTEKFFYPLNYELVPIVLGGANYSEFAPPHSYINVEDYESPRKLAEYLKYLSENEAEYNKYFQWKQTLMVSNGELWCDLCEAAMKRASFHKERTPKELLNWWNDGTCHNDLVQKKLLAHKR